MTIQERDPGFRINQVVWLIIGIINTLLVLRIIFLLLEARKIGFAEFLYSFTLPLVKPFQGIFPVPVSNGAYFDTAALVAVIIYTLIAWGISALIDIATRQTTEIQ